MSVCCCLFVCLSVCSFFVCLFVCICIIVLASLCALSSSIIIVSNFNILKTDTFSACWICVAPCVCVCVCVCVSIIHGNQTRLAVSFVCVCACVCLFVFTVLLPPALPSCFSLLMLALCYFHPLSCSVFTAQTVCLTHFQGVSEVLFGAHFTQCTVFLANVFTSRHVAFSQRTTNVPVCWLWSSSCTTHSQRERERETDRQTDRQTDR